MLERLMKISLRYVFFVWIACLALAYNCSGVDEKSIVKERKPIPDFSIPDKIPARKYVYFIALGYGGRPQKHVARLMNEKARKDSLHFVITLGDNFYNNGVTSISDRQWLEKFEDMYDLPNLKIPFYASLGNHDHRKGNARHQVEYSKKNDKWKMPDYYYTFSKKIDENSSIQFFALDTYVITMRREHYLEQIEWLERELQVSTATWKIVYGHHPVFSYGKHGNERQMIDRVRPLLEKYNVDVYICGHDHDRQLLEPVNGVYYIISGTGSKSRDTRYGETTIFAETNLGFAWVRVSAGEFHVQFINADGDVEYAQTWTKGAVPKRPYEAFGKVGRFNDD
jgi:acid phosphatase